MRFLRAFLLLSLAATPALAQQYDERYPPRPDPYYAPQPDYPPPDYDDPYRHHHHDDYDRRPAPPPPPLVCVVRAPGLPPTTCGTQPSRPGDSCHCRPNPFPGVKEYDRR